MVKRLRKLAFDYIGDYPSSLLKAFYWNGITRFWDIRRPAHAVDEVPFEGRSKKVTEVGLAMYYLLLPLALVGLWKARSRREIWIPVVALAVASSIVFTVASGTRYRAPLEPLIVVLACSAVVPAVLRRRAGSEPVPSPSSEPRTAEASLPSRTL